MSSPWLRPEWRPTVPTTVVCVHGAIVNGWEMTLLRHRLKQLGYRVRQFRYYSMTHGMEANVARLKTFLNETEGEVLHVVGHSMGGVVTRRVFQQDPDPRPGRLVAIGSPFLDCWIARRPQRWGKWTRFLMGKTVHDHITHGCDPVWRGQREFGVLAGTYPLGIGLVFPDMPRRTDGVVLWEETRLQNVTAHITFNLPHFGMLLAPSCAAQVARFLATGTMSSDDKLSPALPLGQLAANA